MLDIVTLYTDGACTVETGAGGYAVVVSTPSGLRKISGGAKNTTNNCMELTAVLVALKYIYNKLIVQFPNAQYQVITDSTYCYNAITLGWLNNWISNGFKTAAGKPVKNVSLWLEVKKALDNLDSCLDDGDVKFIKVKGHNGDTFNELADALAVMAKRKIEGR